MIEKAFDAKTLASGRVFLVGHSDRHYPAIPHQMKWRRLVASQKGDILVIPTISPRRILRRIDSSVS
jgi:hypothetical protein